MTQEAPWKETYTGQRVNFTDPKPGNIYIEDIAHSLARTCRYGGHCRTEGIWSVAEHSLIVEEWLHKRTRNYRLRLLGLLHDAAEAYIGDLPPQAKSLLPEYQRWEKNCEAAIWKAFGLHGPVMDEIETVKAADKAALAAEAAAMMASGGREWPTNTATGNLPHIEPDHWGPPIWESEFLDRFKLLMRANCLKVPGIQVILACPETA